MQTASAGRERAIGLRPAPAQRLASRPIYEAIREGIITGRYAPGERLVETRLAAELGVSRTGIRDALARLQTERLISSAPNRGLIVRHLSSRDIEEIYNLRLLLEGFAANIAATNITTLELDELREIHNSIVQLVERDHQNLNDADHLASIRSITELNNRFHRLIQSASRNSRLVAVLHSIVSLPLVFQSFYWYSRRELTESCNEHESIMRALEDHSGALAEELMKQHITRGLNTLLREMAKS